jgi:hypothetical protein
VRLETAFRVTHWHLINGVGGREHGEFGVAYNFTIENRTTSVLKVRHAASGLRFTFRISEPRSGPQFLISVPAGRLSTRPVRAVIEKAAHAFATREARKADLID